ncbi:MAG: hypothetical protein LBQ38_05855 [Spirochaetaceae bacterium]|nr:hypothetical protein [Spirochaetaceae bacterium]
MNFDNGERSPDTEDLPNFAEESGAGGVFDAENFDSETFDAENFDSGALDAIDDLTMDDTFADFAEENPELAEDDLDVFGEKTEAEEIPAFSEDRDSLFEDFPESGEDLPAGEKADPEAGEEDNLEDYREVSLEDFLDTVPPAAKTPPPKAAEPPKTAEADAGSDLSTRLLMKIAEELAAIKGELSQLKQEFAVVRGGAASAEPGEAGPAAGGGFFDEEDDEKIALTGDELDNILHTAEFTEETGDDATKAIADEFADTGADAVFTDSLPETALDIPAEEPELPSPEPEEAGGEPEPAGASLDDTAIEEVVNLHSDSPELRNLMEQGAEPLTPLPEDTSYLDEDPLAPRQIEEFGETSGISLDESLDLSVEEISDVAPDLSMDYPADLSSDESLTDLQDFSSQDFPSIDLSGAVIDEPDLGGVLTEIPLEEPSLENFSVELDLEEPALEERPEAAISREPPEDEIVLPPFTGGADLNAEDLPDADTEAILDAAALIDPGEEETPVEGTGAINLGDTGDIFEIEEPLLPEEDSLDQVIPEGFMVESVDVPSSFDDQDMDSEAIDIGAEALPEAEEELLPDIGDTAGLEAIPPSRSSEKTAAKTEKIPENFKQELKTVLSYMDQLLESLPEEKIEEFAKSEYFDSYKKLFEELGLA